MTDTTTPAPTCPEFDYPRTAAEWWEQATYVAHVMREWGPNNEPMHPLFAANMPLALRHFGRELVDYAAAHPRRGLYDALATFIAERNGMMAWRIFQAVWQEAPDAPYIHGWTGWGRLCDLCSEGPALLCLADE